MISKELLETVLELKIQGDFIVFNDRIDFVYYIDSTLFNKIMNIHELAHKCKEWLENNTHWDVMIIGYEVYLMEDIWGEGGAVTLKRFTAEREWYLNLFNAAQYILEQKGLK